MRGILGVVLIRRQQNARGGGPVAPPSSGLSCISRCRAVLRAGYPRPVQHGGRVELDPVLPVDPKPLVLRVRANCGGRLFTAKLGVVLHNLAHQLLNHLLADEPMLLACQFCDHP